MTQRPFTLAVCANNRDILTRNLLASPALRDVPHQTLVQEGFRSAARAYNDAIDRSTNDMIVFCHQDMIFPSSWPADLEKTLGHLESTDPNWGVLGCYGATRDHGHRGYIYSHGLGILGAPFESPAVVQTLDEIVLMLRKSSGLRFDDDLPDFHMYGADICMAAAKRGMKSYAISAFCVHNTTFNLVLSRGFYDAYKHIQRTWNEYLPIQTSCIRITSLGIPMYTRRVHEVYLRHIRHKRIGASRIGNTDELISKVNSLSRPSEIKV